MVHTAKLVLLALAAAACGVDARSVSTLAPDPAGAAGTSVSSEPSEGPPGSTRSEVGAGSAGAGGGAAALAGGSEPERDEATPDGGADPACEGEGCSLPPQGDVTLSFSFDGAPSGQVTLTAGTTALACPASCTLAVPRGSTVTLTALPAPGGTVARWSDTSCGNEISCSLRLERDTPVQVAMELGFNVVFTSSAQYLTVELPRPGAEANQRCAQLAAGAGLPGQRWVAWLAAEGPTTASEDDIDPIEGFQHTGGWVRPDGVIVASSLAALRNGEVLHGRSLDPTGAQSANYAWTGASALGILLRDPDGTTRDCDNWTLADVGRSGGLSAGAGLGTAFGGSTGNSCNARAGLLCFGDDSDKQVPIVTATPNRLAFLAAALLVPGGGINAGDALCQQEACEAGLTGSQDCGQSLGVTRIFKSYMHRAGQPAWQRFNLERPNWVRPDGLLWLRAADLANDGLGRLTGMNVTLSRAYLTFNAGNWVGDTSPEGNCQDWTSTAGQGLISLHDVDDGVALGGFRSIPCTQGGRIYCLEE